MVFCRGAVNCFFMNSGYFLESKQKRIITQESFAGTIRLYKQVWLYSFIVFWLATFTGINSFSKTGLLRAIFPCMGNQYWFMTVFLLLSLLRPFFAKFGDTLSKAELRSLVIILLVFDGTQAAFGINVFNEQGNGFLHAVTMVAFGYSLRRGAAPTLRKTNAALLYIFAGIALRGSSIIINRIPGSPISYWNNMMVYNSPLVILMAYALFSFFADMKVNTTLFSKLSGSVLAVYMIQDHSAMRGNFWEKIVYCPDFYGSRLMPLHYLISVSIIVAAGILIDRLIKLTCRNINTKMKSFNDK